MGKGRLKPAIQLIAKINFVLIEDFLISSKTTPVPTFHLADDVT
jgi:hypothetical protein